MSNPCQLQRLPQMADGVAEQHVSLRRRALLFLKRTLSPSQKRAIKRRITRIIEWKRASTSHAQTPADRPVGAPSLQAGDRIRVREWDAIKATLDNWNELRGCVFMDEMKPYCGTEQRVLRPVRQFLDERDYRLKKCRGLVLLDGVMCQGMEAYGPCDRSCYFFWRTEWLARIDD